MISRMKNIRLYRRIVSIFLTALFSAIMLCGCSNSSDSVETTQETVSSAAIGFNYVETQIPLNFDEEEYIGGILLNEMGQPAMYTFYEGKKETAYYVSILQEDGTWKKEKATWSDNLSRMASKVGDTPFEIVVGSDGNLYLWMSKEEPVKNEEDELNLSFHLVSISPNGYVEELKNEGLGKDMASCEINRLNGFHVIDNKTGIFAEGNWALYNLKTGKKKLMYDGIRTMLNDSGELTFVRSFVLGNNLYTVADDNCDKLNVFDIASGTLEKTISCNSITTKGDTFFIPDEESNAFYTVNLMGIHRTDVKTEQDELIISNNNALENEDYKIEGAFVTGEDQEQFYIWYSNKNRSSDEYGTPYLYKYILNE
ncbi:MAG: hypothetical protein J1F02_04125 [Lachnospiraceae bacterium]|nr:hypothetical protein [Lachnospiraceae bacterium]